MNGMQTIQAKLVTPRTGQWVQASQCARILHRFDEVCNLISDRGDILSLVSPRIGPGPFQVVVDWPSAEIPSTAPITIHAQEGWLTVGTVRVGLTSAEMWNPVPNWSALRGRPFASERDHLAQDVGAALDELVAGLASAETARVESAVRWLAGRGEGLTPSGDDLLVGVAYALWVLGWEAEWMALLRDSAEGRTTSLSRAFLHAAAEGEAVAAWHRLATGATDAVDQIRAIGHTSGRDAWAGFTHTLHAIPPLRPHSPVD